MRSVPVFVAMLVCLAAAAPRGAAPSQPDSPPFERTAQRLARGKYLVEGLAHCFDCHSERDHSGDVIRGTEGGGRVLPPEESNVALPHFLVCPNITPDRETGAGTWTDAQFARAIREGIGHDGRMLSITMPYWNFRYLSDEDLASVVVFIRSIPPVRHLLPKRDLPAEPVTDWRPQVQPTPLPSNAPALARRGEYLVHIGNCTACHTTADPKNHPVPGMQFGGGRVLFARGAPSPAPT